MSTDNRFHTYDASTGPNSAFGLHAGVVIPIFRVFGWKAACNIQPRRFAYNHVSRRITTRKSYNHRITISPPTMSYGCISMHITCLQYYFVHSDYMQGWLYRYSPFWVSGRALASPQAAGKQFGTYNHVDLRITTCLRV